MVSLTHRFLKIKLIFFALALAFIVPSVATAQSRSSVGAIVSWSGFVFISRDGVDDMIDVEDNETLYKGDVILTAKGSRAKILLNDDSILNISESATFKIKDFVYKKKKSFRFASFKMITGSVRTLVGRYFGSKGSGFEIATDTAVVGVKGTDFIVDIGEGGRSEVFSLSGKVSTRGPSESPDKAIILRPGFKTRVVTGDKPTKPAKFNRERVRALLSKTSIKAGISKEERKALVEAKRGVGVERRRAILGNIQKRRDAIDPAHKRSSKKERTSSAVKRSSGKGKEVAAVGSAAAGKKPREVIKKKKKKENVPRRRGRLSAKNKSTGASARCSDCHQKVYRAVTSYGYQHPDTMSTCIACHLKSSSVENKYSAPELSTYNILFLDTKRDMPYVVKALVIDESGEEANSKPFKFTPSQLKYPVKDTATLPAVSIPVVVAVKAGMFNSAVIEWKTDKPTLGYVEYGRSSKLGDKTRVESGGQYSTDHRASVASLTVGKTYYFRGVSTDVFGNKGESITIKFKVRKPFALPKVSKDKVMPRVLDFKVVSVKGRPALSWKTDVKTTAVVTLTEGISRLDISKDDPHYPGLNTNTASGHDSCGQCHSGKIHKNTSHSMGTVSYDVVTVKARELYYGNRGILICSTCHKPHGGNFPYTLRKDQTDLCDSCHMRP